MNANKASSAGEERTAITEDNPPNVSSSFNINYAPSLEEARADEQVKLIEPRNPNGRSDCEEEQVNLIAAHNPNRRSTYQEDQRSLIEPHASKRRSVYEEQMKPIEPHRSNRRRSTYEEQYPSPSADPPATAAAAAAQQPFLNQPTVEIWGPITPRDRYSAAAAAARPTTANPALQRLVNGHARNAIVVTTFTQTREESGIGGIEGTGEGKEKEMEKSRAERRGLRKRFKDWWRRIMRW